MLLIESWVWGNGIMLLIEEEDADDYVGGRAPLFKDMLFAVGFRLALLL